jgi:hypothetical protein
MHTFAIICRYGGALYALIDVLNNKNIMQFISVQTINNAKLNAKRFILFTSVLDSLLQARSGADSDCTNCVEMVISFEKNNA